MVICAHCRTDFLFFLLDAKHALVRPSGSGENRYLSCAFLNCDKSCLIHSFPVMGGINFSLLTGLVFTAATSI